MAIASLVSETGESPSRYLNVFNDEVLSTILYHWYSMVESRRLVPFVECSVVQFKYLVVVNSKEALSEALLAWQFLSEEKLLIKKK